MGGKSLSRDERPEDGVRSPRQWRMGKPQLGVVLAVAEVDGFLNTEAAVKSLLMRSLSMGVILAEELNNV
jgi:hypothetical protein